MDVGSKPCLLELHVNTHKCASVSVHTRTHARTHEHTYTHIHTHTPTIISMPASFTFVSDPDQHMCEVQLVHAEMCTARKHCNAHAEYTKFRSALELLDTFGVMNNFEEFDKDCEEFQKKYRAQIDLPPELGPLIEAHGHIFAKTSTAGSINDVDEQKDNAIVASTLNTTRELELRSLPEANQEMAVTAILDTHLELRRLQSANAKFQEQLQQQREYFEKQLQAQRQEFEAILREQRQDLQQYIRTQNVQVNTRQ